MIRKPIIIAIMMLSLLHHIRSEDLFSVISQSMGKKIEKDSTESRRILIVGLDGFTWNELDPLIKSGQMPNLQALINEGVKLDLESTVFPSSAAAWPAIATGCKANQSGMHSFFNLDPETYSMKLNHAGLRKVKAIWELASDHGKKVIAVNVPVSWPVDEINGVMIGGFLSDKSQVFTHPAILSKILRDRNYITGYRAFKPNVEFGEATNIAMHNESDVNKLMEISLSRYQIISHTLKHCDWDFGMVVFTLPDRMQHNQALLGNTMIEHAYKQMDVLLGGIQRVLPEDAGLIVCSDHGFRKYTKTYCMAEKLRRLGFLSTDSKGMPIWTESKLIPLDRVGNNGLYRWNLINREKHGTVKESDTHELFKALSTVLKKEIDPQGNKVVSDILQYQLNPDGPELLIQLNEDIYLSNDVPIQGTVFKYLSWEVYDHERTGVGVLYGKNLFLKGHQMTASVLDIAPTALYAMGMSIPGNMDGNVLLEAISPETKNNIPIIKSEHSNRKTIPVFTRKKDDVMMDQLKSLGYIN